MKSRVLGAMCACVFTFITATANAAFVLTIDDLGNGVGVDITEMDINNDGIISYAGGTTDFSVVVSTGFSKPSINGPQLLHLNNVQITGSSAGTLVISLTDTDYAGSPEALTGKFGGTQPAGGKINFDFLYDENNAEFGGASFFGSGELTDPGYGGQGTNTVGTTSSFYSLTIIATLDHAGGGEISSFDAEISAVPVPAAVWLFGSGLLGLVGVARRRKA